MQNIVKGFLSTISFANPLLKDHELGALITSSLAWKIYSGVKRGTNEEVAIFIFDKKIIEKYPKATQDVIITILKRDASSLAKLRHPSVLRILSPLEETKTDMVVITEPISYTLRALCSSSTLPPMDMVEIKKCAYDISDGLYFLHEAARMVHRRICPDTIFCTDKGEWKIGGLGFSYPADSPDAPLDVREIESNPNTDVFQFIGNTEFLAPEMMNGLVANSFSDIYALGRVIYFMICHTDELANPMFENGRSSSEIYTSRIDRLQIDPVRSEFIRPLLIPDPHLRANAEQFLRSGFFQDTNTRVLLFLRNFVQQDDSNKLQFLKGLQKAIHKFSQRIICQHVLPPLVLEIKNDKLSAPVLGNIFLASQTISNEDFNKIVMPHVVSLYKGTAVLSPAVYVVLLENLATVFNKAKPDVASTHLASFLVRALSTNKIDVVAEALNQLPMLIGNPAMTMEAIKTGVLPRLQYICQNAASEQLRVSTLACFAKLVPIMERYLTLEFVMPSLTHLSQSDRSLPISVALISVYEVVVQQFDAELLAQRLLPSLLPLSVDKDINIDQFKVVMRIVRLAIDKLEQSRLVELSKKKVETAVPLAEPANNREWESFEQTQQRILAAPVTAPKVNLPTPQITPAPISLAPIIPSIQAALSPSPLNQNIPKPITSPIHTSPSTPIKPVPTTSPSIKPSPSPSHSPSPVNITPTPQPPISSGSGSNLFAGLETKKVPMNASIKNSGNNSDPFGSLGELQEQMKKRPAVITPTKPTPTINPSFSNTPLIPSISSNAPMLSPSVHSSPTLAPTLAPTTNSNNVPKNFSLAGLNINSSPSPQPPATHPAEAFGTSLNSFMDL